MIGPTGKRGSDRSTRRRSPVFTPFSTKDFGVTKPSFFLRDMSFSISCYVMIMGSASQMSGDDVILENSSTSSSVSFWKDTLLYFAHQASVYGVAAGYCISASLLSIINKWAVMKFPYPGALTALQYFTSAFGVMLCGWLKLMEHDRLDLITIWKFLPAAIIFYLSLFTNSELLLHANVDTFIVFRSVVPMFVAVGESAFLKQPWPSSKTWLSLATIFAGSVVYVLTDYQFTVTAYTWAMAYLVSMSIDFVYIKHVVMTIGLNTWGLVLYNNLEALMLFPLELLIMGELKKITHDISDEYEWHSFSVILPVALSCLFGLAISFFGFSCRRAISATGFTVLGIVNKLLTVVINLVIWDKHSTLIGTIGLLICMFGGVLYQRSTTRPQKPEAETETENKDEEQQELLEMKATEEAGLMDTAKVPLCFSFLHKLFHKLLINLVSRFEVMDQGVLCKRMISLK
ncbi:GDP-mannose transporter GONST3-like [Zingiber officinale]|uniref:GDP-mannose transporter GONST3-like n=1 Tax=Zingiber officinale TaxID=94328 RepID=UPI001C4CAE8B|nr:GDP-mannose transporter GONST3-like [Zingiber officinale]